MKLAHFTNEADPNVIDEYVVIMYDDANPGNWHQANYELAGIFDFEPADDLCRLPTERALRAKP